MRSALIALVVVVAIVGGGWLALFGTTPPCDAARAEIAKALAAEDAKVIATATDVTSTLGSFQCAATAVRLHLGDRSAVTVVKVPAPSVKK